MLVVRSTKVTSPMLDAGRLALIVRAGAGYNTIDVAGASQRGIYVSNCPGKNAIAVAELAFALILALDRRLPDNVAELRAGKWNKKEYSKAQGLYGRTLGLLGIGSIGQEMVKRAAGIGPERRPLEPPLRRPATRRSPIRKPASSAWKRRARQIRHRAGADARATSPRPPTSSASIWRLAPTRTGLVNAEFLLADEAGGVLHQHRARRGRRSRRARRRGPRQGPPGRTRRVRERARRQPPAISTIALVGMPGVYGTHHIGASTDQAQEAIAAETVRIVRCYKETGRVPNVVNLARRTPATHMLVVRHRDRPGVLAHVFDLLREANLNVQETENIVFEGAEAAVARINLDGPPPGKCAADQGTGTRIFSICRW